MREKDEHDMHRHISCFRYADITFQICRYHVSDIRARKRARKKDEQVKKKVQLPCEKSEET
eukprot:769223-Amorphochlora_amoeboformis.AAC.1